METDGPGPDAGTTADGGTGDPDAGTTADAGTGDGPSDDGCSCSAGHRGRPNGAWLLLLAAVALGALRRRPDRGACPAVVTGLERGGEAAPRRRRAVGRARDRRRVADDAARLFHGGA